MPTISRSDELLGLLRWHPDPRRTFFTGQQRWALAISWDGVASEGEVSELVTKRILRHPLLGDPHPEEELIV